MSVAAELDGQVVAGAVCNPAAGEIFHARRGGGAWLRRTGERRSDAAGGDARLSGPRRVPLERAVVGTGFAYDAATRQRQAAAVAPLLPRIGDIRRLGSAALDLCAVAAGRLDAYFETGLHLWDYAAGALIAAEAGCVVHGPDGGPPSARFVMACAPVLADALHDALREIGAEPVA